MPGTAAEELEEGCGLGARMKKKAFVVRFEATKGFVTFPPIPPPIVKIESGFVAKGSAVMGR